MKMVKSLLLGSAAGLIAVAGAQAADMPVKAKPAEYVKICSLYGAGFYYIPGTDTCIKIGGYVRVQTDLHGGQRLHLHAGLAGGAHRGRDVEGALGLVGLELDIDVGEEERMAEGDELVGLLGGHDAGDLSDREDVALGHSPGLDQRQRLRLHAHAGGSHRPAGGIGLGRYVHHARPAGVVEVG